MASTVSTSSGQILRLARPDQECEGRDQTEDAAHAPRIPALARRAGEDSTPRLRVGRTRLPHAGWWLVLLLVAVGHGFLTLALFSSAPDARWSGLTDDRPIISGRHALHLYHGALGARALQDHGRTLCFDPANYAGYPKTPWLDSGSRPAEVCLWLHGLSSPTSSETGSLEETGFLGKPAAYKIGVAAIWWMAPLLLALGAAVLRSGLPAACGAAWLGSLLCWSDLGRAWLLAGDLDLLLAAGFAVLHAACLVSYASRPTVAIWLGLTVSSTGLVFCQPLLVVVPLLIGLLSGLRYMGRRGLWWYVGLTSAAGLMLAANGAWLYDATRFWWIQADAPGAATLPTLLGRVLGKWSLFTALLGLAISVSRVLVAWRPTRLLLAGAVLPMSLWLVTCHVAADWSLPLGLPEDVTKTVAVLQEQTTPAARILCEETSATDAWTPLLPALTQRQFIGGLGQPAAIEHAAGRLRDGFLAGRWLALWTDGELADYCRRYNIGWVVCRTRAAAERLSQWSAAESRPALPDGAAFFTVRREPSFFLVGRGNVAGCDSRSLTLTDLEPVNGQVVLSFHFPPRVWAASQWARIEKEPQVNDAIPFLRIRLTEPMTRLTLYWNAD